VVAGREWGEYRPLEERDIFSSLTLATQVGVTVVVSILGCLFLGLWIDSKLHSRPWATLILIAFGILVAIAGTYRLVYPVIEQVIGKQKAEMPTEEMLRPLALATQVGLMAVAPVLIGLFLGLWIDGRLQTRPLVTLSLAAFGIIVGLVGAYRLSSSLTQQLTKGSKKENS
jgi:ATP synthase protein I